MAAVRKDEKTAHGKKHQFCKLYIGERLFGVDILDVREINPEVGFTPIFHAPGEVRGYVNIRGKIHLILDLRLVLGLESRETDESSRVMLFKPGVGESFGILVDRIGEVVEADETVIEDRRKTDKGSPAGIERRASGIGSGVCKLKEGLLVILNARNLLKIVEEHRQKAA